MKEKLNKFLSRHTQAMTFLWMIVGGYLAYLAWQLVTGDPGEANPVILYIAAAVFVIVGVLLVAVSAYSLFGKHYKNPLPLSDDSGEDEPEE